MLLHWARRRAGTPSRDPTPLAPGRCGRARLLLVATALSGLAPAASWASCAGCASPYAVWPDPASPLPLNPVLIVGYCSAGDPDYGPYLEGPRGRIPLKRVEVAGLGPDLRAFVPGASLEPHHRYDLRFRKKELLSRAPASWTTGEALDSQPPVWRAPPAVEYAGSTRDLGWGSSEVFVTIPAVDDGGALAVVVELRGDAATTADVPAPQVDLRRVTVSTETIDPLLVLESEYCSRFNLPAGRVFQARLAVIDAAGNLVPSPAGALRFRIPDPRPQPSYEVRTVVPRHPPVVSKSEPPFPAIAKKARIQGVVTGELSVGPAGWVEEVTILEGLPLGMNEITIAALEKWRFAPARDGAPRRKVAFQTHFMVIQPEYRPDWNP